MSVMSTTAAGQLALPGLRARKANLDVEVLIQVAVAVVPAMLLVGLTRISLGAYYMAFMPYVLMMYNAIFRKRYQFLSMTVGCIPVTVLLRGVAFYRGITFLLFIELVIWCFLSQAEIKTIVKDRLWCWLVLMSALYWWISYVRTQDFFSNMRALDFALAVTALYILAHNRTYLATAFAGIALSTTCLALGMLPLKGERLGMAQVGGVLLGNPVLLGVPAAFVVLLCFAENGRWLLMEDRPLLRTVICLNSGEWLILSGSRGSWTIALIGMCLILVFGKQDKRPLLLVVGLAAFATLAVLSTPRGSQVLYQYNRSLDGDRSLANRTSGRSIQWEALPKVFEQSPVWGWGPGSGRDVVEKYTGHSLEWHSLYLQIIGDTGLLGFFILLAFISMFFYRTIKHLRRYGEIGPMIGLISFLTLGLSVQAMDSFSGILVGLVFLPSGPIGRYVLSRGVIAVSESPALRPMPLSR